MYLQDCFLYVYWMFRRAMGYLIVEWITLDGYLLLPLPTIKSLAAAITLVVSLLTITYKDNHKAG